MNEHYDYLEPVPEPLDEEAFPWPPGERDAPVDALGRTWRGASLEPRSFFRTIPRQAPIGPALLYYLIIGIAAAGARLFWALLGVGLDREQDAVLGEAGFSLSPVVEFLLSPLLLLFSIFVAAAIVHGLLKLFGGARHGFDLTTRVFAFAYSPAILEIVPYLGGLTGFIWMTVLLVVGLKEAHRTSIGRVLAAVMIPLAFALGFIMAATFLLATGELFRL